jgi:hypothetical protein
MLVGVDDDHNAFDGIEVRATFHDVLEFIKFVKGKQAIPWAIIMQIGDLGCPPWFCSGQGSSAPFPVPPNGLIVVHIIISFLSDARHSRDAGFSVSAAPEIAAMPDASLADVAGDPVNVRWRRRWEFLCLPNGQFQQAVSR